MMASIRQTSVVASVAVVALLAGGCATAMRGGKQGMSFATDPPGAKVTVVSDGKPVPQAWTTPVEVELKRNQVHQVTLSKEGYRPVTFELKAQWDGASLPGLILPGGSLSVASDRASGADLAFYPLPTIKLTPSAGSSAEPITMFQHRGKLLTKEEYDKVIEQERKELYSKEII